MEPDDPSAVPIASDETIPGIVGLGKTGPRKIGKYPVVGLLGQGAMGKVYIGADPFIGRQVAIKVLAGAADPEARARFVEEARTIGHLSHPNIVTLLEFGFHDDSPFLVMELLKGKSLESWLEDRHPLAETLRILRDLCRAVVHAHAEGILHRDIKPSNAQVLPDGTCKLMDFGIARSGSLKQTATGLVLGTPQFIAPEVLREVAYTPASDTYALGLVAYQSLAGHNPFAATTLEACLAKILTLDPPALASLRPDVPLAVSRLVDACLSKDPERRPTLEVLLAALEGALANSSGVSPASAHHATAMATYALPRAAQTQTGSRRRIGLSLAAAILVGGGLVLLRNLDQPDQTASRPSAASQPATGPQAAVPPTTTSTVAEPSATLATTAPDTTSGNPAADEVPAGPSAGQAAEASPRPGTERSTIPAAPAGLAPDPRTTTQPEKSEPVTVAIEPSAPTSTATSPATPAPTPAPTTAVPPPPAPSVTPATVVAPPVAETPEPALRLRSLAPAIVRRGNATSIEIAGEGLDASTRVVVLRGLRPATGIAVRRTSLSKAGTLVVALFVDSNAPLGLYSVQVTNTTGGSSNSLGLEVGL